MLPERITILKKTPLIILGSYAFAEEVADLVSDCENYVLSAFAENWDISRTENFLQGLPVRWIDDLPAYVDTHEVICAIGTTKRSNFIQQVEKMRFRFAILQHPFARVSRTSDLGEGCILSAGVVIAAHSRIGQHVILNRGSLVGHHTSIGNYVTISPGANIAGRVTIGDHTYIGMGAIILNDISIGSHAAIGAGSVVTKDVPDNVQVVGFPAMVSKENIEGW